MLVRAASTNAETMLGHRSGLGSCVGYVLILVFLEGGLHRFYQAHCFGRNRVHQRTAWRPREGELVEFLGKGGLAKHQSAARTAQGLVGRRRNDIRVRHGAWMNAGRDESGNVRHVHEKE